VVVVGAHDELLPEVGDRLEEADRVEEAERRVERPIHHEARQLVGPPREVVVEEPGEEVGAHVVRQLRHPLADPHRRRIDRLHEAEVEERTAAREVAHVDDDRLAGADHHVAAVEVEVDARVRVRDRLDLPAEELDVGRREKRRHLG